ncbi:hypothetical protein FPOAC2_02055 [Fusarium poae]|uniref:hypothetical protein n=1 Tax=Fusarium poae TaxID=36050 RepID=UPI001CEB6BD3|nr:hypothetical protein FPOAC1_001969 [Fusarium poae]KAG8675973.1 hypothetical protein FPOAC1_001969 [Fusarium poae]
MPKDLKSRKKERRRLRKEQQTLRIEKPDIPKESPDERRSRKKKRRSEKKESLDTIRTTLFSLHNSIINRNRTTSIEKREFCSRMGNLYSNMLELAFELGTTEEDTEMEWQHEPTNPVHLVSTAEEMACYPDGAVIRPWQTASTPNCPSTPSSDPSTPSSDPSTPSSSSSIPSNSLVGQRCEFIREIL